jgi:hypothetical protein
MKPEVKRSCEYNGGRRFWLNFKILSVAPNQQVGGKNANADDEVPADRENQ